MGVYDDKGLILQQDVKMEIAKILRFRRKKRYREYRAIIFDLDGTLINSLPYHSLAFKDLLLEHSIRIHDSRLRRLIGMPTTDILKELKRTYGFKENVQDLREERRYHYFKFLGNRNISFPRVLSTLKKLRLNHKLAVATGSSKVIFTHSTDKDFQELFDFVVTINEVKKGKPHPGQFILAAHKLHIPIKECLVVGDSIYDAIAAKRAGMDFFGVATGYTSRQILLGYGALEVLDSAANLPDILDK